MCQIDSFHFNEGIISHVTVNLGFVYYFDNQNVSGGFTVPSCRNTPLPRSLVTTVCHLIKKYPPKLL